MDQIILECKHVTKKFGGLMALDDVSFCIRCGIIKAVIGPNGAGKTTLFNVITGIIPASGGDVIFSGSSVVNTPAFRRTRMGIGHTFQSPQVFENMSVIENVMVGRHPRTKSELAAAIFFTPRSRKEETEIYEEAYEYTRLVGLESKMLYSAKNLSYGELKLLEIARALATEPTILLLDEPTCGLTVQETDTIMDIIYKIKEKGVAVLLIEHNMRMVMRISDEVVVINYGRYLAEGTPVEIQNNESVVEVYLGKEVEFAQD